jgi:hypothetical protein
MLADGARTGTVGYGEQDGPPCGPWTRAGRVLSWPMSGTVGLGTLDLSAAKLHRRHDRRLDLIVASAGRDFGPRLTGCLFPPGSPGITVPWASLPSPGRASVVGTVSPLCRNAVLPYSRQTSAGVRASRGHGPRDVRFVRRMRGPARVPRLPSRRASQTTMRRGYVRVTAKRQGADPARRSGWSASTPGTTRRSGQRSQRSRAGWGPAGDERRDAVQVDPAGRARRG